MDNVNRVTSCSAVSSVTGVENEPGRSQHLYVMQSELGPIKIGRANDVEKRRRALQGAHGAKIAVIATFPGRGCEEPAILRQLRSYRREGEWFTDTYEARNAIRAAVSSTIAFTQELSLQAQIVERKRKQDERHAREAAQYDADFERMHEADQANRWERNGASNE